MIALAQELLFVFGLNWGVVGAALAPAIGQYVGLAVMVSLLLREKVLFARHLQRIPTFAEVKPLLQVRGRTLMISAPISHPQCQLFRLFILGLASRRHLATLANLTKCGLARRSDVVRVCQAAAYVLVW